MLLRFILGVGYFSCYCDSVGGRSNLRKVLARGGGGAGISSSAGRL